MIACEGDVVVVTINDDDGTVIDCGTHTGGLHLTKHKLQLVEEHTAI